MRECGRHSEMEPVEYHGDPLRRLADVDYRGMTPTLGEYCNICENFPCLGNHPPDDGAHHDLNVGR